MGGTDSGKAIAHPIMQIYNVHSDDGVKAERLRGFLIGSESAHLAARVSIEDVLSIDSS